MTTTRSTQRRPPDGGRPEGHRLPSELRGRRLWLKVAIASVVLHVAAFTVLSGLHRPAPPPTPREERIALPPPERRYQVRVVRPPAPPTPPPAATTVPPPARRAEPTRVAPSRSTPTRLQRPVARAPRPARSKAPARTEAAPRPAQVLDLTQATAGVRPGLTSGSGPGGFQVGSTALGDPGGPAGATGSGAGNRAAAPAPETAPAASAPRSPARAAPKVVKRMPEAVAVPKASYPAAAKRKRVEGTVRLLVTVDARGRVVAVRLLRGLGHGLDEAAIQALKRARFRPALGEDDRPLAYSIRYRYTFRLEG